MVLVLSAGCGGGAVPSASPESTPPSAHTPVRGPEPRTWPEVSPTPQRVSRIGQDLSVPGVVRLHVGKEVDQPTTEVVGDVLRSAGASQVDVGDVADGKTSDTNTLSVVLGTLGDQNVTRALTALGTPVPSTLPAEGYVLTAGRRAGAPTVVLTGQDADGLFHAAQTLRQLTGRGAVAGVTVVDHPTVPIRGVVEGFYGRPWSFEDRMEHLAFSGAMKMNTYLYAPKDDPYHRDRWREPYPAEEAEKLAQLVRQAKRNHVRFTFAISPGQSVCHSGEADRDALRRKMRAVHDMGVRSFSVALDDITPLPAWSCADDLARYGLLTEATFGQAQAELLNALQRDLAETFADTEPLEMVPVQYSEVVNSPYKRALRELLDPRVRVMWTGVGVLPSAVTAGDARRAREVWGRKVLLWDNYPTNDFNGSAGRLLLAPYDRREAGAMRELAGVLLNPMNQAAASELPLFTAADFAWNPAGYDAAESARAAARRLANGNEDVVRALLLLIDVEHHVPDPNGDPLRPQAPELARQLDGFRAAWARGERDAALTALRSTAQRMIDARSVIHDGVADREFVDDVDPWLTALSLWGRALSRTCDALAAKAGGNTAQAEAVFQEAKELADQTNGIRTRPGITSEPGVVRVADGVLDTFLGQARTL
ncbi:beta-N-acetylhexosaminidase family protein [Streptoalloteichus hindustanus]|uniref:beta-N-acetylhexosaminidase family protein n=1 Tax=Streptoalloteichus hindustanus TaxID=2017 RepID=UPI001F1C6B49|nr:beta-N-acetylglucosaminidase domain-containing protein [Streptoalloteichus hindustanus]